MRQILLNFKTGATEVTDVPAPSAAPGHLLIRTSRSVVSVGTERMLVDFGKAGWIDKARQQPDKVRMVLDKTRTDGLMSTMDAVMSKLDQPLPLGYSNVGTVLEVGAGVTGFNVGDRVVSNGKHAEVVAVPMNLCAAVPTGVSDDAAAFTVVGAIALQGIRLVQPTLGETVVVTGLGLIGLITVQLLRAHGCRVIGIDLDPAKLALARKLSAHTVDLKASVDPVAAAMSFSRGRGVDAVIITASTTSSEPVHQAALMSRKRGRIVLVGVTGLELSRADFYEKELTFQVSCSYGPGRHDPSFENDGVDYPVGFVRWTEQRNFEAVLDMMADGRLDLEPLISHRFALSKAEDAYQVVSGSEPSLGILLTYPTPAEKPEAELRRSSVGVTPSVEKTSNAPTISVVGTGNYATGILIPAFVAAGAKLRSVGSRAGVSGVHAAKKFAAEETTTDTAALLSDPSADAVVIITRHDTHARMTCDALRARKHVFVEKPLALDYGQLAEVEAAFNESAARGENRMLMVGFNRRFAPHVVRIKELLAGATGPKAFVMTVNAGAIPKAHWTQDPEIGGGRITGEACHFIDLLRHLAASPIEGFDVRAMSRTSDTATIILRFADGSIGSIHYFANGHKSFPKERLEVFAGGRILRLDNFRSLTAFGWPGAGSMRLWRQDKGQRACAAAFVQAMQRGGPSPIPPGELFEVSRVTIDIAMALRTGATS